MADKHICPMCGFDGLKEEPFGPNNEPSYEICPRCGFEPGFDREKGRLKPNNASDHMANERTFLAWIRTGIGIIAFGFVIERFALFMKQMTFVIGKSAMPSHATGYSNWVGIILVFAGTLISLLAFIQFKDSQKRIEQGTYRPSSRLYLLVTVLVVAVGLFLVLFLSSVS